jgi:hypothetical protein
MMYVIYGLWALAAIIMLRLGFSLYYQWRYQNIVKSSPRKQKQLLLQYASPLVLVLALSFGLQFQTQEPPNMSILDHKTLPAQNYDAYSENASSIRTAQDAELKGYVLVEEDGVEVKYYVITIKGVDYLILEPSE